jgi:hypothetical protein
VPSCFGVGKEARSSGPALVAGFAIEPGEGACDVGVSEGVAVAESDAALSAAGVGAELGPPPLHPVSARSAIAAAVARRPARRVTGTG